MSIGLTDNIVPLGTFPILEDTHLKGGFRVVADATARDAIDTNARVEGMVVRTVDDNKLWSLGAGLTNSDWTLASFVQGSEPIDLEFYAAGATPFVAHTFTTLTGGVGFGGNFTYELTVQGANLADQAVFKILALFRLQSSTIDEQDVLFVGDYGIQLNWNVTFNISTNNIELTLDSPVDIDWKVRGSISYIYNT